MNNNSEAEMIEEFSIEASDLFDQAESDLLHLERGSELKGFYDSIFRVFHSVKGGAGMLGLNTLQVHMHSLENTLSSLKAKPRLTQDEVNYFLNGVDAGRKILRGEPTSFLHETKTQSTKVKNSALSTPSATLEKGKHEKLNQFKPEIKRALVYIVDDEPDILETLSEILDADTFISKRFTNPLLALEEITKTPPDVVLSDLRMPEMSGLELLQKIHSVHPEIPVILISGYMTTENLLEAIRAGVFAAIEKPFSVKVVLTYTHAASKQGRTLQALRKGLNLLLYQFSDLEDFLIANGREDIAKTSRNELTKLLAQWKELSGSKPVNGK